MPGIDWNKLALQTGGDQMEQMTGSPSDVTTTAQMLGFRPNPAASPLQQQQNLSQFMAMQKNIMDSMMGGPNGVYAKMSPGNPMAGMPLNYQNMMGAAAGMFTNPMVSPTMPGGGPAFGGPNGYQFGPVSSNMSPLMSGMMQQLAQGQSNGQPNTSLYPQLTGGAGTTVPGGGAATASQAQNGPGGAQGNSPITVNTQGSPLPRTAALIQQILGNNAVPPGADPYNHLDTILSQALSNYAGGQGQGQQGQQSGGQQSGGNPLAAVLAHLP